jgi:PleD family two-component response regulator
MNRILLADDSPHAQRMGERILRDEGYEVVSVTDGETALMRLADVDPDVIVADVFLPGRSGLELCREVKGRARHRHVRLVLTAGLLEVFDEDEARAAGADAIIKKPFEASVVVETVKPLIAEAQSARSVFPDLEGAAQEPATLAVVEGDEGATGDVTDPNPLPPAGTQHTVTEEERVRAAVVVALDAAFPALVDEITSRVLSSQRDRS